MLTFLLIISPGVKEGEVIVLAKDEITTRRKEKEQYQKAKEAGIAHLFKWESHVYKK